MDRPATNVPVGQAPPRMTPSGNVPTVFNPADWIPKKREITYNKK